MFRAALSSGGGSAAVFGCFGAVGARAVAGASTGRQGHLFAAVFAADGFGRVYVVAEDAESFGTIFGERHVPSASTAEGACRAWHGGSFSGCSAEPFFDPAVGWRLLRLLQKGRGRRSGSAGYATKTAALEPFAASLAAHSPTVPYSSTFAWQHCTQLGSLPASVRGAHMSQSSVG